MSNSPILLFGVPLLIVAAVATVAFLAVSSSDDGPDLSQIRVEEGRISCDAFGVMRGYRYTAKAVQDLKFRPPEITPSGTDNYRPDGFIFTTEIEGDVQGTERIHQFTVLPENEQVSDFVVIGERLYFSFNDEPHQDQLLSESGFIVPYIPGAICNAMAPDLFLAELEGTAEDVNGVASTRYSFEGLETNFPSRLISFGAGSDIGRFVTSFTGDIWVADVGGYIVKMDLLGQGTYENGRGLELYMAYELSDVNEDVSVEAPY